MSSQAAEVPALSAIVQATSDIHTLPLIYEQLGSAINNPRSSSSDIARIINADQGLTVRILRLANSPMFGSFRKVDSIPHAITIIGTQQLRDLALAVSMVGMFGDLPADLSGFWRHSIACGVVSRNIATRLRQGNIERYFVAGMLHDVGILVLCSQLPDRFAAVVESCRASGRLYHCVEEELLGFQHGALGAAIMDRWKIPATITDPVLGHHEPARAGLFPLEAAVVHLADIICYALEYGGVVDNCVPPLSPAAWVRLDLSVAEIGRIIKVSETQIDETFAILAEG